MPYDLIIRDATLVSSSGRIVADVAIQNGEIAYVGPRPPLQAKSEISGIGKFLMPGVIDSAVQFDPDGNPKTWEVESSAAVSGGITTVISLPGGDEPVTTMLSAQKRATRVKGHSWCNYALWAAANAENASEINEATTSGYIVGALATLGESQGQQAMKASDLENFQSCPGVLGIQIGEAVDVDARSTTNTKRFEYVEHMLRTMGAQGTKLHIVHLSTAAELQMLDPMRGSVPVTASVTPHHLFLSSEEDANVCTLPPVRKEHDRRTLWSAVKRGRLDCIASDHHPNKHTRQPGVPGSELLFPLMLSAVQHGRLSIELLVALCSERPAEIFGLSQKGRIAVGYDADLILFSEGELAQISTDELISQAGWTPYERREVAPKPEYVIVNGTIVARDGVLVGNTPTGRLITRPLNAAA
jgi:dihydroorotase